MESTLKQRISGDSHANSSTERQGCQRSSHGCGGLHPFHLDQRINQLWPHHEFELTIRAIGGYTAPGREGPPPHRLSIRPILWLELKFVGDQVSQLSELQIRGSKICQTQCLGHFSCSRRMVGRLAVESEQSEEGWRQLLSVADAEQGSLETVLGSDRLVHVINRHGYIRKFNGEDFRT